LVHDEVLLMKADGNDYYYAHDHLYSPAALIDSSGTVLERYEYDAYGNCSILEPNFAPDPDGKSDYENPYLFTGRRLDIMDNSSLKIQYNRNRYYDYYTGRWLTHDPLGYLDSMNLYEYVGSQPATELDPQGLWTSHIHEFATMMWAYEENKMLAWAAIKVGYWDYYVDTWKNPVTINHEKLSWHFDMDLTEVDPVWGPTDTRYEHAKDQYNKAITWCDRAADATGCETKRKYVDNALEELGKGLHPLQDWVAHGSWKPFPTALHIWPFHPTGTDDHNLDFRHHPSGILRDWDYFGIFGGLLARPLFIPDNKRLTLTKKRTVDYLDSFKDECSITCKCQIYSVLHGRK